MIVAAAVVVTLIGLAVTLAAARRGHRGAQLLAKPAASVGFLVVAIGSGALDSAYGGWVLAALVLSFAGDVLLLFESRFRAGLAAFLAAHVAYIGAFLVAGVSAGWAAVAAIAAAASAAGAWRWLRGHVDAALRVPVLAYMVVISTMLAMAAGTQTAKIAAGAALFYVSDLAVARERFVAASFVNRLVGLPLYYAGQLLLAFSVGS